MTHPYLGMNVQSVLAEGTWERSLCWLSLRSVEVPVLLLCAVNTSRAQF